MRKIYLATLALASAHLLTACDTLPTLDGAKPIPEAQPAQLPAVAEQQVQRANALYQQGRKREAAEAYYQAGTASASPERERLILQAIEVAAMLPDKIMMNRFFGSISTQQLNQSNRARYNYAKALLALMNDQAEIALDILPTNFNGLQPGLADKIMITRLKAADQTGDILRMVEERVRQEARLQKDSDKQRVHQQIWQLLGKLSSEQLNNYRRQASERNLRGWLDLAYIKAAFSTPVELARNVFNWKRNFPNHAAKNISDTLTRSYTSANNNTVVAGSTGKPVAVMLPFSGAYANVGNDLFKGIADAHRRLSPNTPLFKHDTSNLDATVVYNQALQQGAKFLIGPFQKNNLVSMSRNGHLPVPALSLNYLPAATPHPANMLQIGLLPEDEAMQAAGYAYQRGHTRALVMAPDTAWGKRLEDAFSNTYRSKGGSIVKTVRYPNRASNYSNETSELLSAADGADMIFLAASPTQARLIYPALTADESEENKPEVYATSHIYSGRPSPSLDNNLNGIIYTEIPYILNSKSDVTHKYPRLYALGQDAFEISRHLEDLQAGGAINGLTGKIHYKSDGSLHRSLQWATFNEGVPTAYSP